VPDTSFQELLTSAVEGSESAWMELYRRFAGPVLGYLRSRGAADADDLVGEVFLQLARNIGSFEGDETQFRSWVFVIAHHRVVDERRRLMRKPVVLRGDADALDRPDPQDVEGSAVEMATERDMAALLETLTPDQRAVITLRIVGDLTLDETARVLGKRLGAVTQLQRRALASLRRALEQRGVTR
jgi:RNA polymerase sigma-70 factor (ECF subfamily)